MPKPNRLVVLGGAPHMIARVAAAAGDNVRASVAGFSAVKTTFRWRGVKGPCRLPFVNVDGAFAVDLTICVG